jgi:nucleoid-associated protein YgaU
MRRDTQIGIILGVVILVVIGVFLSTRTTDKKTEIPDLMLSEKGTTESEIEEIDINEIIKEKITTTAKETTPVEKHSKETPIKTSKNDTSLEGKWEGIETASTEPEETSSEIPVAEEITEITEKIEVAQQTLSDDRETITEENHKRSSVGISGKIIHKVRPNDNLLNISRRYYGDETKWKKIYVANKGNVKNPDTLYIGQELLIPEIKNEKKKTLGSEVPLEKKPEKGTTINSGTHIVVSGDTLYNLARKYYNDSAMWDIIYNANEETIDDKRLLKTGQILIIPELLVH